MKKFSMARAGPRKAGQAGRQRDGLVPDHIDPHLTIALMIGGIRQALIGALMSEQRPDSEQLTDEIWAFMAAALRLTAGAGIDKNGRHKVA